jgi:hypothetical protein
MILLITETPLRQAFRNLGSVRFLPDNITSGMQDVRFQPKRWQKKARLIELEMDADSGVPNAEYLNSPDTAGWVYAI